MRRPASQSAIATVGANLAMIAEREGDIDAAIQYAPNELDDAALRPRTRAPSRRHGMLARLGDCTDCGRATVRRADDFHRGHRDGRRDSVSECESDRSRRTGGRPSAGADELDEAERDAETALAMMRSSGLWNGVPKMLATLGMIAEQRGHFDEAHAFHHRALRASRSGGDGRAAALALEGLASLALVNSDPDPRPGCSAGPPSSGAAAVLASGPVSDVERITAQAHAELGDVSVRQRVRRGCRDTARGTRRQLTARCSAQVAVTSGRGRAASAHDLSIGHLGRRHIRPTRRDHR